MAAATDTPKVTDQVKDLREQVELALLQRIQASIAQATAQELMELLNLYTTMRQSDWYKV